MIKIYQINTDRDKNNAKFLPFGRKEFDFSIYDEVWSGERPDGCDNLEGIFEVFNINRPSDFKGHSLSVSDIVQFIGTNEWLNGYYYCDSFGWKKLDIK